MVKSIRNVSFCIRYVASKRIRLEEYRTNKKNESLELYSGINKKAEPGVRKDPGKIGMSNIFLLRF
jgi:hypothetical protein